MSLYKNTVAVPFEGALDTKTAEKLLPGGSFLDLQNVVRRKRGIFEKRYGFTALGQGVLGGSTSISDGKRLDSFYSELLLADKSNLYSYLPAKDQWSDRGALGSVAINTYPVIRNNDKQVMSDGDYLDGIEVYAWEDSRGGVRCSAIDSETGAFIIADQEVSATGTRPKVVALENVVLITYREGTNFRVRRVTIGEPSTLQAAQTIEAGMGDFPYDICRFNNVAVFVYNTTVPVIRTGFILPTGVVGSAGSNGYADPVSLAIAGQNAVSITASSEKIYFSFHDTGGVEANDVRYYIYDSNLVSLSSGDLDNIASVRNIALAVDSTGILTAIYEMSAAATYNHRTKLNTVSAAYTIGTAATFKRSVGLATKAAVINGSVYVGVVHESTLQSTYFLVKSDGSIVARMQGSFASGLSRDSSGTLKSGLSRLFQSDTDYWNAALPVKNKLTTLTSTAQSGFIGINRQTMKFNSTDYDTAILGRNLHIAGGTLTDYDGVRTIEHGFHLFPEGGFAIAAATSGSLTASSNYRVKLIYEWVDGQGQIHRSASPAALSVTLGAGDDEITVTAPTLRLTGKSRVKIVVYRTKSNEITVFYRDNEAVNDLTADTVTISLTQADTTLANQEILYTVGGVLDNVAPPAAKVVNTHKNRLWLAATEDDTIWYSKAHADGEGVAFNDGQKVRFAGATAVGSLDEKLIIFKERGLYSLQGDGPLDTGAQNDYGEPELISSDVGCSNPRSIVVMPLGLMFQSEKGIYLLDRALSVAYIGDKVEDFNNLTITSATVLADQNEVRFTTDGVCLVYNYYFNEWYTFTNHAAVGGVNGLDTYCHLTSAGKVNKEVSEQYNDNGQTYSMRLETNWFQFSKIQGFQRIFRWALLGDFVSHCIARVKLAYDFESSYNETIYFNTEDGLGTEVYGDDTYGETEIYGGSSSQVFQFRSKPRIQKCESIKLLIEDIDTLSDAGGASFKLASAAFEVGTKSGIKKMSASKTRGL